MTPFTTAPSCVFVEHRLSLVSESPALSDLAGRPGAVRFIGLKAPAQEHVDGALDLCVPIGVDDGVDHGVVGGWQQGGVGVHLGIFPPANQAVDGEGKPAGPKCPQDDGQSGNALFRGHVM